MPYPLISLVTRLPQTLQGQCPVTFSCRTFETFTISFVKDSDAFDVFESVKELTVASASIIVLIHSYSSVDHLCQRLLLSYMHFIMPRIRRFLQMTVGHYILPEKNLAGWVLDLGRGPGGSLISTRTIRSVTSNSILPSWTHSQILAVSDIPCTSGGTDENQ